MSGKPDSQALERLAIIKELEKAADLTQQPEAQRAAFQRANDLIDESSFSKGFHLPAAVDAAYRRALR